MMRLSLLASTSLVLALLVQLTACHPRTELRDMVSDFENYGRILANSGKEFMKRLKAENGQVRDQTLAFLLYTSLSENSNAETVPLLAKMLVIFPKKGFYSTKEFSAFRTGVLSGATPEKWWPQPQKGSKAERTWKDGHNLMARIARGDAQVEEGMKRARLLLRSNDLDECGVGCQLLISILRGHPGKKVEVIRLLKTSAQSHSAGLSKSYLTEISQILEELESQSS